MRFHSIEEAHKAHIDNYRSDGVQKQYGNPNQAHYLRVRYFIDQVPDNARVLDVGCNGGFNGWRLSSGVRTVDSFAEISRTPFQPAAMAVS